MLAYRMILFTCLAAQAAAVKSAGADGARGAPGLTPSSRSAPLPRARPSYRRQIVIADGIAAGVVGGSVMAGTWLFSPDDFHLPLMIGSLGFTSYVLTAPIIHIAHGNVGRGLLSGTARVLGPAIVGSTVVSAAGLEEDDDRYGATFAAGLALGAVAAIAVDWWLLAPGDAVDTSSPPPPPYVPIVSVQRGGGLVGFTGAW